MNAIEMVAAVEIVMAMVMAAVTVSLGIYCREIMRQHAEMRSALSSIQAEARQLLDAIADGVQKSRG